MAVPCVVAVSLMLMLMVLSSVNSGLKLELERIDMMEDNTSSYSNITTIYRVAG